VAASMIIEGEVRANLGWLHARRRFNPNDPSLSARSSGYIPPLSAPVSYSERLYARKYFAPLPLPSLADRLEGKLTTASKRLSSRGGDASMWRFRLNPASPRSNLPNQNV
jgi:hypothetical protein